MANSITKAGGILKSGSIKYFITPLLKNVMSLAAEAEIGAVFINAKEGAVLRTTL
jgi:hypothetical protein